MVESTADESDRQIDTKDSSAVKLPEITVPRRAGRQKGSKNKIYIPNPIYERITRSKALISGATESGTSESALTVRPTPTSSAQKAGKNGFLVYQYAFIAASHFLEDPRSLKEVLKSVDRKHWFKALNIKHDKIKSRDIFVIVNRKDVPKGQKILSIKPIFKTKRDINGHITKYKARIVIRGFKQQYDKDFNQTFAGIYRNIT